MNRFVHLRLLNVVGRLCLGTSWLLLSLVGSWYVLRSAAIADAASSSQVGLIQNGAVREHPTVSAQPTAAATVPSAKLAPTITAHAVKLVPTATSMPMATATPAPTTMPLTAVDRIQVPAIGMDRQVVQVERDEAGEWVVPDVAVGHHSDSAQPGEGQKIILNGHVAMPPVPAFGDLHRLVVGDEIYLSRGDTVFSYRVTASEYIKVEGVESTVVQEAANRVFAPVDEEMLLLITCFPASGQAAFSERLVVWASPVVAAQPTIEHDARIEPR